jgi:hypothetical protein
MPRPAPVTNATRPSSPVNCIATSRLRLFREDDDRLWLFDHLVGGDEQRWRHREAERLGGLEVDHELELGRLPNWKITDFLALRMRPV